MPAQDGTTVFVQEYAKRRLKLQITSVLSVCWHLKSCDHDLEYYAASPAFTLPPFDLSPFFFCIQPQPFRFTIAMLTRRKISFEKLAVTGA